MAVFDRDIRYRLRSVGTGLLAALLILGPMGAPASAATSPSRPAVVRGNVWHLRNSLTTGVGETSFAYGRQDDVPLMGDWDGDGIKTPGVVRGNVWYLRNSNTTGDGEIVFGFGKATDIPVVGDWDGDGTDTVGVVRITTAMPQESAASSSVTCGPGFNTWYVRNANSTGAADEVFVYECPGDPLTGDWDGDGDDTPGLRIRNTNFWALNNELDTHPDTTLFYGSATDFPVVGDWDGDGDDSVGIVRGNVWHLKYENTTGDGDLSFAYGKATDYPLVWGDTSVP